MDHSTHCTFPESQLVNAKDLFLFRCVSYSVNEPLHGNESKRNHVWFGVSASVSEHLNRL